MPTRKSLKPDESINKILISTTSRFVGEYESENIYISHAWPNFSNSSRLMLTLESNPASRSAFIVSFRTEPTEKKAGRVVPDYSPVGDLVSSYLSVLYGKRIDSHGLTEGSGVYHTPDLSLYNSICNNRLPFNSFNPRTILPVPLNLTEFSNIEKLLTQHNDNKSYVSIFQSASKFYLQALQNAENEPEVAYLHLITAGEIISGYFNYDKSEVMDELMLKNLEIIRKKLEGGDKIAKQIIGRLLSIKKRFVKSICSLVDQSFFISRNTENQFGFFKNEDFEERISAAYDLRSKYIHTGISFGNWIKPDNRNEDIQLGNPVVNDEGFAKTLALAPRFLGLERVIRFCLLRLLIDNGFDTLKKYHKNT